MFRRISHFFNHLSGSDSFETEQSFPALILSILSLPFRLFYHFAVFMVTYWASSRSMRAFVRGVPAMAAVAMFLMALIVASFLLERTLVSTYEGHFAYQMNNNDPEIAAEYADKLMGLMPEEPRYAYQLGLARSQSNEAVSALNVMKYLADVAYYPQAQIWLAETLISDDAMEMPMDARTNQAIEYYSDAITNLDNKKEVFASTQAHLGLAEAYRSQSSIAKTEVARDLSLRKAIESLVKVTKGDIIYAGQLEAIPRLIKFYQETGQITAARNQLRNTMKSVGPIARRFPDNLKIWSILVTSCVLVDDFDYAEEIIEEGFQLASSPETKNNISRLHSQVLIKKADNIKDISNENNYRVKLAVVAAAITADPMSISGYERLIEFAAPEEESPEQGLWLRRSLIGSNSPGIIHIVLGLRAFNRGEILEGERHWLVATQQTLQAQRIINFLIDYAHTKTPERIDNLKDIISVAIDRFPNQFIFYITRGKIHLSEQDYQKAVNDFEIAARKYPNSIVIRDSLAKAYGKLGMTEKANENRELANEWKLEMEKKQMELLERRK